MFYFFSFNVKIVFNLIGSKSTGSMKSSVEDAHRQKLEGVERDHSIIVVSSQKHRGGILHSDYLFPRPPDVVNRRESICRGINSNIL